METSAVPKVAAGRANRASSEKSTIKRMLRFAVVVGEAMTDGGGRMGGGGNQSSGVLGRGEARR